MKASELKELTLDELQARERDMRKELFNLRFQAATGEIANPRRIRKVKKDIARILTYVGQKTKAEGKEGR